MWRVSLSLLHDPLIRVDLLSMNSHEINLRLPILGGATRSLYGWS